jgi:hypothetical protein
MAVHNTIKKRLWVALSLMIYSAGNAHAAHPGPQPRSGPSTQNTAGDTTTVITSPAIFPEQDPFDDPPGSNFLGDTVFQNMRDGKGAEMPNTLPSTPDNPYNLHPDPVATSINKTSPTDDLSTALKRIRRTLRGKGKAHRPSIKRALRILEGRPMKNRVYSGFPLLHYNGPEKVKAVEPIVDRNRNIIGGNVTVHQIWFDSHIESDTAFIDPSKVLGVPWTITYIIDTLNRGHDDFAPMVMYTDDPSLTPGRPPLPHVAMDQTFFPMNEGTRTVFEIGMAPGKYYNLTYHWGWRVHPPRVQVAENALKRIRGRTLPEWEIGVFGPHPTKNTRTRKAAIAKIGNLAPAKRMWNALQAMEKASRKGAGNKARMRVLLKRAERAFADWKDRTKLPGGLQPDSDSDWTLLYVNNTIYGQIPDIKDDTAVSFPKWTTRGTNVKIKLYNGDYFDHAYVNVDFGGQRGWENSFHSTVPIGGAGPWFTFGRFHWWMNAGAPPVGLIVVPAATHQGGGQRDIIGVHNVDLTMTFEPSRRLRWYQFDPLHHDVAVWSIH